MLETPGYYSCMGILFLTINLSLKHDRKALFLSRLSRREEAIECALLSISGFPWNWSCWTLLGSCIGDGEEVTEIIFWCYVILNSLL